jgi:hypothetical protein
MLSDAHCLKGEKKEDRYEWDGESPKILECALSLIQHAFCWNIMQYI